LIRLTYLLWELVKAPGPHYAAKTLARFGISEKRQFMRDCGAKRLRAASKFVNWIKAPKNHVYYHPFYLRPQGFNRIDPAPPYWAIECWSHAVHFLLQVVSTLPM